MGLGVREGRVFKTDDIESNLTRSDCPTKHLLSTISLPGAHWLNILLGVTAAARRYP
jgi:hypothetical protein